MENNKEEIPVQTPPVKIRFSPEEECCCYIDLRSQLIKLLYMIEAEQRGECDIHLFFDEFVFYLSSANNLCSNKLLKILIKIHGLYDNEKYKSMTHAQIRRQILESKGILDSLINNKNV